MSTPLPQSVDDLPAHVARPLSEAERSALPALDWQEHEPPYLPPSLKVVFEHGRLTAPECGGEWLIGAEEKNSHGHVDIKFALSFPKEPAEFRELMEASRGFETGSLEWFLSVNKTQQQELGRAGNQRWARLAVEALRHHSAAGDLEAQIVAGGFEYAHTVNNWAQLPVKIYYKHLPGNHFLQLNLCPISASLQIEKNGSGCSDLIVSFHTNTQNQEDRWIPSLWPDVVADPARSIAFAVLETSHVFEQEWEPKPRRKKAPKA
jgi:hypothetical protein